MGTYISLFFVDFPHLDIFEDSLTVSSTTTNLNNRKRKESLAFTYFSSSLHLSLDKTLQGHTYFICNTMFSFHVFLMSKKYKILQKAWKKSLAFTFHCVSKKCIFHTALRVSFTQFHSICKYFFPISEFSYLIIRFLN